MALAMAMFLVGMNPEEFNCLISSLTPNSSKIRTVQLQVEAVRAVSPSARSESSGIGSIASSSLRSLEGSSCWPTPSSSAAPSVRSSEGSVISLTPSSSRAPSVRSYDGSTPSPTPVSSRPMTPTEETPNIEAMADTTLVDFPTQRRDILDLAANIKAAGWQVIHPLMTHIDPFSCIENETVDYTAKAFNFTEDYPMRFCGKCDFGFPSPYLFERTMKKETAN